MKSIILLIPTQNGHIKWPSCLAPYTTHTSLKNGLGLLYNKSAKRSLIVNNIGHQGGYIHEGKKPVLNLQTVKKLSFHYMYILGRIK